jgi:hypothetical protein
MGMRAIAQLPSMPYWLSHSITRHVPLERFALALPRPADIKVIIDCLQ